MAITMYQSDRNTVSPANDASLYTAITNGQSVILPRGNNFNITVNGLVATIGTGQAIIQGRLIEITQPETLTLPANSSGYIAIVVDLTKTNDVSGEIGTPSYSVKVNQVYLAAVTGTLTQDDLNNGGFVNEMAIAKFTTTTTTATTTVQQNLMFDTGWQNLSLAGGNSFVASDSFAQFRLLNNVIYVRIKGLNVSKSTNGNQVGTLTPLFSPDVALYFAAHTYSSSAVNIVGLNVRTDGFMYVDFTGSNTRTNVNANFNYPLE
ncbi:hypothetical protein CRI85_05865 [Leuconostoc pseudomesenteroides]|uniref:hypothetical protein n=1 Tax=Leuconostoc pseudomesenteroides TaxID=33968 RepID=UPI001E50E90C|nr:hypothetical protein [Leuconostoc pseudomesenteroides]MCC8439859.1 hypothetical protein [Leuconostoc pseudomesenteroides]